MSATRLKKTKQISPPDHAVAGPSRDAKGKSSQKVRTKLDFTKKPLSGKKFYLELTGQRRKSQHEKLKAEIEELGGVVEPFLSKDLACVISDRPEARDGERSKVMPSGTSPAVSTPSPFHQTKDSTPNAADSPSNVTQDARVVTRGQAIVQKATKSQMYGTTNVLTNAKNFGIPIKHLDVLVKYLGKEREKLKLMGKDKKKGGKDILGVKGKERQLTKPYLKAEDVSRRFRPIHKEFKNWPRILLDTRKGSCPYDPTTRNETNPQEAERTQDKPDASQKTPDVRHRELSRSQSLSRKAINKSRGSLASKVKAAKKGFCEFCSVKYNSLEKHLKSEQHKRLVEEKNNFFNLDSMIAEGPNLSRFLEDCAKFRSAEGEVSSQSEPIMLDRSGSEDEVMLLSEPTTPVKQRCTPKKKSFREGEVDKAAVDLVRRSLGIAQERLSPVADANEVEEQDAENHQRPAGPQRNSKEPSKSLGKRSPSTSPKKKLSKGPRKKRLSLSPKKSALSVSPRKKRLSLSPRKEFGKCANNRSKENLFVDKNVDSRTCDRKERLDGAIDAAGDAPVNGSLEKSGDHLANEEDSTNVEHSKHATPRESELQKSLPDGPSASGSKRASYKSPGASGANESPTDSPRASDTRRASTGKKRQSGSRRSLSLLQPRKSRTAQATPQGMPEGSSADTVSQDDVVRGIAGEEELAPQNGFAEEVVITRVLREGACEDNNNISSRVGQVCSASVGEGAEPAVENRVNERPITVQRTLSVAETAPPSVPGGSQDVSPNNVKQVRTKRGSQVLQNPSSEQLSSKKVKKRRLMTTDETDQDDVFESNDNVRFYDGIAGSLKRRVAAGGRKTSDTLKRKSRRSHGDAPPRKVRGSSVAVDAMERQSDTCAIEVGASPQIREPQPRVPVLLDSTHSSDDFQSNKTPPFRGSKNSERTGKKSKKSEDKKSSVVHKSTRRASLRNKTSTSQNSAAEDATSELDFQTNKSVGIIVESTPKNDKHRRRKASGKKKHFPYDDVNDNGIQNACNDTTQVSNGPEVDNRLTETEQVSVSQNNDLFNIDNVPATNNEEVRNETNQPLHQQSLEFVFRSELGQEESSFLGFSQEEINETVSQTESFRKVQEESGHLVQNLEKAALSVYCIPSSDPPGEKEVDDDDKSSVGSFGEFTIGLVLQKVDNFPSEGSEWEEQVTGFMQKLDTQLEIKRRRESELSTLPSPNFHKSVFANIEKENQGTLQQVVEDFGPETMSDDEDAPVFVEVTEKEEQVSNRRRSARIHTAVRSATRSTPVSSASFSGMCSPTKKRRTPSSAKREGLPQRIQPEHTSPKQALRELSSNQLRQSPQPGTRVVPFSTPKRNKRLFLESHKSPNSLGVQHIVLPPGTPREVEQEISDNYVHDDSESEVVFPKFSSPVQKGAIFSPVKHRVGSFFSPGKQTARRKKVKQRHRSESCLGHRDVQSSPARPTYIRDWLPFDVPPARKSLFMKGKVKRINFSSPRRRSKSVSHSPAKSSSFLTFLNELKAGLSPTFYTFKKPHFSLRILNPGRRHCCRKKLPRSLLALNLSIPSCLDLRIYEFHDDESLVDDDLAVSPLPNNQARNEHQDQCTQTPPSSHKRRRMGSRRLSVDHKMGTPKSPGTPVQAKMNSSGKRLARKARKDSSIKGNDLEEEEVEFVEERQGLRSVKIQASSPDLNAYFDMPSDYFL